MSKCELALILLQWLRWYSLRSEIRFQQIRLRHAPDSKDILWYVNNINSHQKLNWHLYIWNFLNLFWFYRLEVLKVMRNVCCVFWLVQPRLGVSKKSSSSIVIFDYFCTLIPVQDPLHEPLQDHVAKFGLKRQF